MGLPGHRRTSSDKRKRTAHFNLSIKSAKACEKCGKPILSHRACTYCGTYKGRQVLDISKRTSRSARRAKKNK